MTEAASSPRRFHWSQFGLRAIFALTMLVGVYFAGFVTSRRLDQETVRQAREEAAAARLAEQHAPLSAAQELEELESRRQALRMTYLAVVSELKPIALNRLRDEINSTYGCLDGVPRVNRGPCGRFAKTFHERWNARFRAEVSIAFVMPNDGGECCHVLVKLPDGRFFDGGNGIMSAKALLTLHPDCRIEELSESDLKLLDQRSGGLDRNYPRCPNYSDVLTGVIIEKHLALIPSDLDAP